MLEEIVGQLEGHMASLGVLQIQPVKCRTRTHVIRSSFLQFSRSLAFVSFVHIDTDLVPCKVSTVRSLNPCFGCWGNFISTGHVLEGHTGRQFG